MHHENSALKEDLAVKEKQRVPLNPALRRVHTARHPPRHNILKLYLIQQQQQGEVSRNMVSVPEGALGSNPGRG